MMNGEALLALFKKIEALLDGHFVLRSGLHSRQYFQCAKLLQYPHLASEVCEGLAEIGKGYEVDSVVSPAMGGILVGHEVARGLKKRHVFLEKKDGELVLRRFEIKPGERFLVAEDVVTTGSAVKETCRVIEEHGGVVVAIVCIVDRSGGEDIGLSVPYKSLLQLKVETFREDELPEDLAAIPVSKPGSR